MAKEITKRSENYSQWYNDIVKKAGLADNSAVTRLHGHQTSWGLEYGKK